MSETDKLARIVRHAFLLVGVFVFGLMAAEALSGHIYGADDTDSRTQHSGMSLRTDFGTGCQYLEGRGGITPRLGTDGRQICGARR